MSEHKWICPHCRQTGVNASSIPCPPSCPNYIVPPTALVEPREPEPLTNTEKLRVRFERLRSEGLLDLKIWAPSVAGSSLEELSGEVLEMLDAIEQGRFDDITDKMDEQDLNRGTEQASKASSSSSGEVRPQATPSTQGGSDRQSAVQATGGDAARAEETREVNPPCMLCGGPHPYDTSLPSVRWNAVIRANHYPDYMCLTCIVKAFALANESFTAQLFGGFLNGMPIEVRVNGQAAIDTIPLNEENNQLRCKVRELEAAVADQAPASPAVVERAPLEQLIADWKENSTRAYSNAHNPKIATLDRRQCEGVYQAYEQCADELEALLLAWPSSRERDEGPR